jgi:hypothetical protein
MPPAVFIDLGLEPFRQRRRGAAIRCVADRAGRAGGAAGARVRAFPWFFRMVLADPAAAVAKNYGTIVLARIQLCEYGRCLMQSVI